MHRCIFHPEVDLISNKLYLDQNQLPPCVMWDPFAQIKKYLHFEQGMSDKFTQARKLILSGDMDMPEDAMKAALASGQWCVVRGWC